MSILVVGSAALDSVETPFGKADDALGGSAIYFSTAASYFSNVSIVAVIGDDFPLNKIEYLKNKGVDLSGLTIEKGMSFRWGGKYTHDFNNRETLFTELNVFENFNPQIPDKLKDTPYIFLANIQPDLQLKVLEQIKNPKLIVMDTMNFWIDNTLNDLKNLLKRIDILIINDSETQELSNESNLFKAAKKIKAMGPKILVIKKGEHGAILVSEDDSYFYAPAFPLEQIYDPTGAGDTFAGGFVGYLAKTDNISNSNLKKAIIYGSTLASYCVEKFSVEKTKDLTEQEIEKRYNEFINLTKI